MVEAQSGHKFKSLELPHMDGLPAGHREPASVRGDGEAAPTARGPFERGRSGRLQLTPQDVCRGRRTRRSLNRAVHRHRWQIPNGDLAAASHRDHTPTVRRHSAVANLLVTVSTRRDQRIGFQFPYGHVTASRSRQHIPTVRRDVAAPNRMVGCEPCTVERCN